MSRDPTLFSMPSFLTTNLGNRPCPGLSANEGDEGDVAPGCSCGWKMDQETRVQCQAGLLFFAAMPASFPVFPPRKESQNMLGKTVRLFSCEACGDVCVCLCVCVV